MKFKFKGHIGKSAFFPLPPFVLQLFVYIDCWIFFYGNKHNYYYYYYIILKLVIELKIPNLPRQKCECVPFPLAKLRTYILLPRCHCCCPIKQSPASPIPDLLACFHFLPRIRR